MKAKITLLKLVAKALSGDYNRFVRATCQPEKEQEKVLLDIVKKNQDSAFGQEHGFSRIHSVSDFQSQVPINDYDSLFPWIEKEMNGENGQLTESRILSFVTTSGTTSSSKFIPVNKEYIANYKRGLGTWVIPAFRKHPEMAGKVLTVASSKVERHTPAGIPYGAVSGLMHDNQGFWAKINSVAHEDVFALPSELKMRTLARIALGTRLSHIQTANPLTILNLCKIIERDSESIIQEIYDGKISAPVSEKTRRRMKKDKVRGRELEILLDNNEFTPENFWPDMALVGCWTGGTQYLFLDKLKEKFGNVPFRDIGLLASEGRMTIPLRDNTRSGVLDISGGFFEFIPEKQIDDEKPQVLKASQLELGENYFILLTTRSGLYRYNISDLVNVRGYFNKTPELAFLSKGKHISNLAGEKITEYQIVEAYRKSRVEGMPDEFMLYPRMNGGDLPKYIFLSASQPSPEFIAAFDNALMAENLEYSSRRKGGKLDMIESRIVSASEFEEFGKERMKKGNDSQYKHVYIGGLNFSEHEK
ncbi:MAG: GH3 auxin-responsive promoter family protein [Nanoarchaeota archaeon]